RTKDLAALSTDDLATHVSMHPEEALKMRRRMERLWEQGKYEEALQSLEYIEAHQPSIPEIDYCYALTLHMSGKDPGKAIEFYSRALTHGYPEFWIRYNRGAAFLLIKDAQRARADLEIAHRLDPSHAGVKLMLEKLRQEH